MSEKDFRNVNSVFFLNRCTRGDPERRGKVLLNRVAFIDGKENLQI